MEKAIFGAGCFWGVEAAFRQAKGVHDVACGYSGGDKANPTYEDVCYGRTGHAEVVEVTFDPKEISYLELLKLFWKMHDPTQKNRQGPDIGSQYRSVVFYLSPTQASEAVASMAEEQASGRYRREIVTEILPVKVFYRAEEYHQRYFEKNGIDRGCHL